MSTVGKPIKCRAAVCWEPNKPLSVEEVEVAVPKSGEVRIKLVSTGMCHTDVFFQEGCDPDLKFPIVLGHEGAGIVESVGEGVTRVQTGDKVIPVCVPQCQKCDLCKHPKTNLCDKFFLTMQHNQIDGTSRITCKGKPLNQLFSISTFSEYTVTNEISVAKISPDAPLDKVCLAACCIPSGYGSAVKIGKGSTPSACAVFGLGGVGLNVVQGCKARKASRIIGVDTNSDKEEIAKQFGCTDFVNPKDHEKPIDEVLIEMTKGGVEYSFVSVGDIKAMEYGFSSTHPVFGRTIIIGCADRSLKMSIFPHDLLTGRKLKGTISGSMNNLTDIPKLVDEYLSGRLLFDELISHNFPLEKINDSIDLMAAGKSIRSVILYN